MPNVYKAIANAMAPVPPFGTPPGVVIMANIVGAHNMANLFTAFCNYFHTPGNWTWTGAAVTPSGGAILDGDAKIGQCAALARALRLLAVAAPPFGLGLLPATVGDPGVAGKYTGQHGHGFVSNHPGNPGVLGLRANVFDPNQPIAFGPRTPFYSWEDHKTVPHLGQFYDPSYNHIWANLPQMAQYQVTGEVRRDNVPGYPPAEVLIFVLADSVPAGNQVHFRGLTPTEANARVAPSGMQGPYPGNNPPGNPAP
jgi:hypothetical protein